MYPAVLIALVALLVYVLFVRKSSSMFLAPVRKQGDLSSDDGYLTSRFQTAHAAGQGPQAAYNMVPGEF